MDGQNWRWYRWVVENRLLKSQGPFWTGTLWFRFKAKVSPSPFLSSPIKHRLYRVPHPCSLTSPRLCKKKHNNKPLPRNGQTENRDSTNNGQWLYSSSLTGSIAVCLFSFCSSLSSLLAAIYPTHEIPDTTNAPLFHRQTLHSRPLCSRPLHTHTHTSRSSLLFFLSFTLRFFWVHRNTHTPLFNSSRSSLHHSSFFIFGIAYYPLLLSLYSTSEIAP